MIKPICALLLTVAMAGCSRSEPEAPPQANTTATRPVRPMPRRSPVARPTPAPLPSPAVTATPAPPPAAEIGADEQMLDDAAASGMTARAQRDEEPSEVPPDNLLGQ